MTHSIGSIHLQTVEFCQSQPLVETKNEEKLGSHIVGISETLLFLQYTFRRISL